MASRLFNYNERGWLIQHQYQNYFNQNLSYFSGGYGDLGYFNGNIAATSFSYLFSGAPPYHQFKFKFDVLGRLKVADNTAGSGGDLGVGSGGATELPPVEESTDGEGGTGGEGFAAPSGPSNPPVVYGVSPTPTTWGQTITIDGNHLATQASSNLIKFISLNGGAIYSTTASAVTQIAAGLGTQITVIVPTMPLDAYLVSVTVGNDESNRFDFLEVYPASPMLSSVSASTVVAGGQVTVYGQYLLGCKASIGNLVAPVLSVNAAGTSALLGVPENLPAGVHYVMMLQPAVPNLVPEQGSGIVPVTVQYSNELSYDANGNFLSVKKGTASPTLYGYVGGTNKVSSVSDAGSYTHNANGAILTSPKVSLPIQYDPHTRTTGEMHNDIGSGYETLNEMLYNASGERVLKVSHEKLFKSPWYISKTLYLHGLSEYPLVEKKRDEFYGGVQSETKYVYGASGLICAIDDATGTESYVLKDHLGSTRVAVNGVSGSIIAWHDYSAFGGVWRQSGMEPTNYLYTGQERDSELSLYNYRARMYDEDLMRFYDTDPAGQGFSPFAYAGNNPVIFRDPTGRVIDPVTWLVIGAVALGAAGNVASNWDSITQNGFDIGKFFGFAALGAGQAGLSFAGPAGWAGGGFGVGLGNTLLRGGNIGEALGNGVVGGITGLAGGYAGQYASANVGSTVINGLSIQSPVLQGVVGGGIGGTASGLAGGFVGGYITSGGDLEAAGAAAGNGALGGLIGGSLTGGVAAGVQANAEGRNPFTGLYKTEGGQIPAIRATQPSLVDPNDPINDKGRNALNIMDDMMNKEYRFQSKEGQIAGFTDKGTYYVTEGHHRMAVALALLQMTGDPVHLLNLLQYGRWAPAYPSPPKNNYPFPTPSWLRNYYNGKKK